MNPEDITALILMGCDGSETLVRTAQANAPRIVRGVIDHHFLTFMLPDPVKDHIVGIIIREVNNAAKIMLDCINQFRILARSFGQPSVLRAAAATLDTDVAVAAKNLSSNMQPSALLGTSQDHWKSEATVPYNTAITEQSRAADRIGDIVGELRDTLENMATSIETFYADLNWAWLGAVVAFAGLGVALYAGWTGIGAIIGGVLAIIGALQALISIVMVFTAAGDRNATNAEQLASTTAIDWTKSVFAS
jgi:hypothetical protein